MYLGRVINTGELGVRGELWQGSQPDEGLLQVQPPLVVVNMAHDSQGVWPAPPRTHLVLLKYGVPDDPTGVLPDQCLLGLADSLIVWLQRGVNVLVHCLAGQSRSGYVVVALITRLTGWPIEQSLAWVRQRYEHIMVREHFWQHLQRLETTLIDKS